MAGTGVSLPRAASPSLPWEGGVYFFKSMSEYLNKIIKINSSDYNTLKTNGSITKSGVTYTYDPTNLYLIENDLTDDYVLLGGGGSKLESELNVKSAKTATTATNASYATNASTASSASNLTISDLRSSYPASIATSGKKLAGSFMSNSTLGISDNGAYSDALVLRGYGDSTGGKDNAIIFNKATTNVWHTQFDFGSTSSWGTPILFLDSSNYTSYCPSKTGSGASGTWGISITGNAATATTAASATQADSATKATYLANNTVSSASLALDDNAQFKWYAQINQSTYNGAVIAGGDAYGFAASNNANGILWVRTHPASTNSSGAKTYYGHQIGFSSNGNIYTRCFSAEVATKEGGWKQLINSSNIGDQSVKYSTYLGTSSANYSYSTLSQAFATRDTTISNLTSRLDRTELTLGNKLSVLETSIEDLYDFTLHPAITELKSDRISVVESINLNGRILDTTWIDSCNQAITNTEVIPTIQSNIQTNSNEIQKTSVVTAQKLAEHEEQIQSLIEELKNPKAAQLVAQLLTIMESINLGGVMIKLNSDGKLQIEGDLVVTGVTICG